jgi:hypothetical protein
MSDVDSIVVAGDDGVILDESERFDRQTCYRRGREQTIWTVHQSPVVETTDSVVGELECCWTLRVCQDGVIVTSRTIPYDGQRSYSTEDRPNRADESSIYRLDVEEVIERHAALCSKHGLTVSVADLRERVLAVLDRDDVAVDDDDKHV